MKHKTRAQTAPRKHETLVETAPRKHETRVETADTKCSHRHRGNTDISDILHGRGT